MYDNINNKKSLRKAIIIEYIIAIVVAIFMFFLIPPFLDFMLGDNTGIDGIGQALGLAIIFVIIRYIVVLCVCLINPIRILISYRNEFKLLEPLIKKISVIFIIILPIFFALAIFLEVPISNYLFDKKYNTGEGEYTVDSQELKSSNDFYQELKNRGLLYDENTSLLKDRLNADHDCRNYRYIGNDMQTLKCYEQSSMFGMNEDYFYDSQDKEHLTLDNNVDYPVYIYNAILTLPSQNEKLQYAALGRYSYNSNDYGDYRPFYKDYYIECKILYIDGHIYALLGLGESYDIDVYFRDNYKKENYLDYNNPYNMILSETNNITTYYKQKYYTNGAIDNHGNNYEMAPNTNEKEWTKPFPVRTVKRIDIDTINSIANELQEGTLKESIDYHFIKRAN